MASVQYIMISVFIFSLLLVDLTYGNSLSRIIGGEDTSISSHPYQVSLQDSMGNHKCGGSIINSHWILTAAHCVQSGGASDFRISLNDGTLYGRYTNYGVQNVIKHPQYTGSGSYPNNIALLKTKNQMEFSTFKHQPIALAASNQNFDGWTCTITGWGLTNSNDFNSTSNDLQQTIGTVLTSDGCANAYESIYNHAVHICIANNASGTCHQDSGGPMVCGGILAGVASWGAPGCDITKPSVYSRVSTYRQWIDSTITAN